MFTLSPPLRAASAVDPFAANVTALLHFNGTNGSTTFTDVVGNTWGTLVGLPIISTGRSKFGGASLLQSSGASSIVECAAPGSGLALTGDFTIEGWLYMPSAPGTYNTVVYFNSGGSTDITVRASGTSVEMKNASDAAFAVSPGGSLLGAWFHFFAGRSGSTCYVGAGGTIASQGAGSSATAPVSVLLGGVSDIEYSLDDLRITKGVCRYTGASYTVPTAEFPNP